MKKTILFILATALLGVMVAGCANNDAGPNPEAGKKGEANTTTKTTTPDAK
ncbi:MAG: hypothetical protein ABUL49_00390 [bacterium]